MQKMLLELLCMVLRMNSVRCERVPVSLCVCLSSYLLSLLGGP
uniref:Uncharacterized protein n=1 Tax=Rhizophora mucronata TaxID=61149 RepID=A0A2P2Q5V7_RHIMU